MDELNNMDWGDLAAYIVKLRAENEQLKKDKQELTTKLVNLELKMKQAEKRKGRTYAVLISER
jgi:hypothetical protein